MKLTVKERMVLPALYPQKGNLLEQSIVKEITEKTTISEKEATDIKLQRTPRGYQWDLKKEKEIDVELSKVEADFLKEQVSRLDKEKAITQELLDVCLKIKEYEVKKKEQK